MDTTTNGSNNSNAAVIPCSSCCKQRYYNSSTLFYFHFCLIITSTVNTAQLNSWEVSPSAIFWTSRGHSCLPFSPSCACLHTFIFIAHMIGFNIPIARRFFATVTHSGSRAFSDTRKSTKKSLGVFKPAGYRKTLSLVPTICIFDVHDIFPYDI